MKKQMKLAIQMMMAAVMVAGMASCDTTGGDTPDDGKTDPSTIAASNLVAYFPMESTDLGKVTPTGSITSGKIEGAASFVTGRRGKAYKGGSVLSYLEYKVEANNPFLAMKEYSVAMWVKAPATSDGASIMIQLNGGDSNMGNLVVMRESQPVLDSMDIKGYLYNSSTEWKGQDIRRQVPAFLNDKWFHLVSLYNKTTSTMELYANGNKVGESIRYSGPAVNEVQPLLGALTFGTDMTHLRFGAFFKEISGNADSWMKPFNGLLDEVRIYNKALSADEIKSLYDAELTQIN